MIRGAVNEIPKELKEEEKVGTDSICKRSNIIITALHVLNVSYLIGRKTIP